MWIQSFLCPGHLISEIDFWLKHEYLKWLLNVGLISSLQAAHWLHLAVTSNSQMQMHWLLIGKKLEN